MIQYYIDFDSTIISGEILDILAEISLQDNPKKLYLCKEIASITQQGMLGKLSFSESLSKRLALLSAHRDHLSTCITQCKTLLTPSFQDFCRACQKGGDTITIISGGFKEIIQPVLNGIIDPQHIYANTFLYNEKSYIVGADDTNLLAHPQGKVKLIEIFQKSGKQRIMIGDGYTDYETKLGGAVDQFRYYAEHVQRGAIMEKADRIVSNFKEIC